nr:MAG TPA: hypothetical protein [Bacteriophage sp.]
MRFIFVRYSELITNILCRFCVLYQLYLSTF